MAYYPLMIYVLADWAVMKDTATPKQPEGQPNLTTSWITTKTLHSYYIEVWNCCQRKNVALDKSVTSTDDN
jgi:hypothetical protein